MSSTLLDTQLPETQPGVEASTTGIVAGKRLLITGVLTESSIAFSVARLAQDPERLARFLFGDAQDCEVVVVGGGMICIPPNLVHSVSAVDDTLEVEKNPNYFKDSPKGAAKINKVDIRFIPDRQTQMAEMLSGNGRGVSLRPTTGVMKRKCAK